jgi:heme-degrading monooxygenase HmoA
MVCLKPSPWGVRGQKKANNHEYGRIGINARTGDNIMYGTVATLHVQPGQEAALIEEVRAEAEEAEMPGYISQYLYRADADPHTFYLVVMFDSRQSYVANANSPAQHERYLRLRALLTRDPEWGDGEIVYPSVR